MDEPMTPEQVKDRIGYIARQDGRYSPAAFYFINDVVANTVKWLRSGEMSARDVTSSRGEGENNFHISGYELLEGMRRLARERWGLMARSVLSRWGIFRTDDVGEIVFLMVDDPELQWKRREADTKEDFVGVYDFGEVFDNWGD